MSENSSLALARNEQPASEWASSTLSALDPPKASSDAKGPQSTASTPGVVRMPGGMPIFQEVLGEQDMPDVKGLTNEQKVADKDQATMETAGQKAGLPEGVVGYLAPSSDETHSKGQGKPMVATPPSDETSIKHHRLTEFGIGTPPGPPYEGTKDGPIDKPTKESTNSTYITKISPIMTTTNNNPIIRRRSDPLSRHTGYIPGSLHDDTSLAKLPEERRIENLPTHDDEFGGRLGKSGGVGALPGSANESGVALLPDERKELEYKARGIPSAVYSGASADASIRSLPGSRQDATDRFPPDAASSKPESVHSRKREDAGGRTFEQSPELEPHETVGGVTDAGALEHQAPKKLGFIDKVKGEMKILSGKMSHNESRVEEGRKMMGKN